MNFLHKPLDAAGAHFPQMAISLTTMIWGFLVMLPFDAFLASEDFSPVANLAPARIVGTLVWLIALLNMHSIIVEWWATAQYTATGLMVFWAMMGLMFLVIAPSAVSWVLIIGLAWLFGWSAVDAKHNRIDTLNKSG